MKPTTIEEMSRLTGCTRRTVQSRIATLQPLVTRAGGVSLYDSEKALQLIFQTMPTGAEAGRPSLNDAKVEELQSRTELNRIKIETEQKTRPHIDIVMSLIDAMTGEILSIHRGLPDELQDRLCAELRELPGRIKW
jgi:DNA-binding transcriptional MerR regulator